MVMFLQPVTAQPVMGSSTTRYVAGASSKTSGSVVVVEGAEGTGSAAAER